MSRRMRRPALACVLLPLLLAACQGGPDRASGAEDRPDQEGEAAPGHGGGIAVTHFTPRSELFVEWPPFVRGEPSAFAVHLTDLASFRPLAEGIVVVRLIGPNGREQRFEARPSDAPGIFRPIATPQAVGQHRLVVEHRRGAQVDAHDLGSHRIFASRAEAEKSLPPGEEPSGQVAFLKEQQWKVDFAHAPVGTAELRSGPLVRVEVRAAPGGEALIGAPVTGRVEATRLFPFVGQPVRRGQVLFRIRPVSDDAAGAAALLAERARSAAEVQAAGADLARLEGLLRQGAVARRRVDEARARLAGARGALAAAGEGLASLGPAALTSAVSGSVAEVSVRPGETVQAGATLARIVDRSRLLVEVRLPESAAGAARDAAGLVIEPPGGEAIVLLPPRARLVAVGAAIDPRTRTLPLLFAVGSGDLALPVGLVAPGRLLSGAPQAVPVVPRSAIVDDAGQSVVYVLADGEAFERRVVRTGLRQGDRVEIVEGVSPGERVVTRGAYLVRLAEAGPASAGHGHAH